METSTQLIIFGIKRYKYVNNSIVYELVFTINDDRHVFQNTEKN